QLDDAWMIDAREEMSFRRALIEDFDSDRFLGLEIEPAVDGSFRPVTDQLLKLKPVSDGNSYQRSHHHKIALFASERAPCATRSGCPSRTEAARHATMPSGAVEAQASSGRIN